MAAQNDMADTLSANYMLSSLTVRTWSGRKTDRNATIELLESKGASADAASVVKSLLAGNDGELQDTRAAYARIRTWFYANSLPWTTQDGQRGDRLVGTAQAMTFLRDFVRLKTEAEKARDRFVETYDAAVSNAAVSLGQLYDPDQYPTKEQVRHLFGATLDIVPMPAVSDFDRVSIPGAMAQGLKGKYEQRARKQVEGAIGDLQQRLIDELDRMATQLTKVATGEKARLHKSLLTGMRTVATLAKSMAPLSSELSTVADRIEGELLQHELSDFRDNAALAGSVARAATGIRRQLAPAEPEPAEPEPPRTIVEKREVLVQKLESSDELEFDDESVFF